jgi:hypothetical protein
MQARIGQYGQERPVSYSQSLFGFGFGFLPLEVSPDASVEIGQGETVAIATITPPFAGDELSVVELGGSLPGQLSINQSDQLIYTAPASVAPGETASFTYEIVDQLGDVSVPVTTSITLDPGPTATDPTFTIGHASQLDLTALVNQLATPGLAGDTLTLVSATASSGTIAVNADGDLVYTPPAGATSGSPVAGPPVAGPATPVLAVSGAAAPGGTATGSGTAPGSGATTDSGAPASGGSQTATGPSWNHVGTPAGDIAITYTVRDQLGDTVQGTAYVAVDPGPTLAPASFTIGHGQSENLTNYLQGLITPGLAGDTETITGVSAEFGQIRPSTQGYDTSGGATGATSLIYQAPAGGNDTITYEVVDAYGDKAAGSVAVTVDPGPILAPGSLTLGRGQMVDLSSYLNSLITPGLAGDTDTIGFIQAQTGQTTDATASGGGNAGQAEIEYIAPAAGSDTISYTVTDQNGDLATGSVAVTVDAGPVANNLTTLVQVGQSIDLTSALLGAAQPGFAGATLTLVGDGTTGTQGTVTLVNGDLVYTAAPAAFAQLAPGQSASDSFSYTIADQFGETATGEVTLTVTAPPPDVIDGNPNGSAVIQGTAGADIINAFGFNNTIYGNGGFDTINAGAGQASVFVDGGNVTVNLNGDENAVTGGDGNDTVSGSQGTTTISLGNGSDTINLAGYANKITVGNGNDPITAGGGNDTVTGGSGNDTVTLGGTDNVVTLAGGNDTITNGLGDDTFNLTGGTSSLALYGSHNMLFLSDTNATVDDQSSGLTVTIAGGGNDVISGALSDPSLVIDLTGGIGGYQTASAAFNALVSDGHGGALLSFGGNGSLDFVNAGPASLHASVFHIT